MILPVHSRRFRQVDVRAEHFERQSKSLEKQCADLEEKYEVRVPCCHVHIRMCLSDLAFSNKPGNKSRAQEDQGGVRGVREADGQSVILHRLLLDIYDGIVDSGFSGVACWTLPHLA